MSDDREERGKDVTDRLSKRFQSDETAQSDKSSKTSKRDKTEKTDMSESTSQTAKSEQRDNVKDRPSVLMYLPEDLHEELDLQFDELNLAHKREHGEALGKNRDYYPAVVQAALEGKDIKEVLDITES